MQNSVLIVNVSDGDTDHLKLMALGAQVIENLLNVAVLGALHVNECLVKVSFGMFAFGQETLLDIVPTLFGGSECHYI